MASAPIAGGASSENDMVEPVTAAVTFDIDTKAMRKIPDGMTLTGVIEVTEVGTAVLDWHVNSRTLAKLP